MEVKACYEKMQADYESVFLRLRSDERIQKYLGRFKEDSNYETLCRALEQKEYETAFMAVHNLKGLSQNLSFTMLEHAASALCEALRGGKAPAEEELTALLGEVAKEYERTVAAVEEL